MKADPKHVVVSGGGSGVGAEIASQFAAAGASVTILGRRQETLDEVAVQTGAFAMSCDVTDRESLDRALATARNQNGPTSIAVANAGSAISKPFGSMTPDDLISMTNVNLLGVFNLWQACLDDMKGQGWGRMIAIASTASLKGYPYVAGYCAAKHAALGLTRSLSVELARTGITVNAICPGFIDTPMLEASVDNIVEKTGMSRQEAEYSLKAGNPMKRFVETAEVAGVVKWLAGEDTGSINGQAIAINGGEI